MSVVVGDLQPRGQILDGGEVVGGRRSGSHLCQPRTPAARRLVASSTAQQRRSWQALPWMIMLSAGHLLMVRPPQKPPVAGLAVDDTGILVSVLQKCGIPVI